MTPRTFVAGTAGHVDHGKSSLVRALTGTDPDRLAEEQLRQMTIDLGFARLVTPSGNQVHIVDVPGHERFVRNMLAGAGGIDAAILTIAADDGPMPQTREHLAILDLLGISRGVVALSKADLIDDEWLGFVGETIRELLSGTGLEGSEIVPVSSTTGVGLIDLQHALDRALDGVARTSRNTAARMPIDRVFSMTGFGTVVTGTLLDGSLRTGDRVVVLPQGVPSRIRGLQTFGAAVETAQPGARVAVNLTGVETSDLARGNLLTMPGAMTAAIRFDARVRMLDSIDRPLRHNDDVIVFAGSSETPAKAALLDTDEVAPGASGWVQLRLASPVAVLAGDRFVLRQPSPAETIGGGTVLELDPPRHKRFQSSVIGRLEQLAAGDPSDRLLAWVGNRFVPEAKLEPWIDGDLLEQVQRDGAVAWAGAPGTRVLAQASTLDMALAAVNERIEAFHAEHPLESGVPRERVRQELGFDRMTFDALAWTSVRRGDIDDLGSLLRRRGYRIELDVERQSRANAYLELLRKNDFEPPAPADAGIEPSLVSALVALGEVVQVGEGIVYLPERIEEAEARLLSALSANLSISLAEFRDLLGTTRKYAQALLEYFDQQRVTRRVGDRRVAFRPSQHRGEVPQI
jgi:selenocysteine-specific elongation factor